MESVDVFVMHIQKQWSVSGQFFDLGDPMKKLAVLVGIIVGLGAALAVEAPREQEKTRIELQYYWPAQGGQRGEWLVFSEVKDKAHGIVTGEKLHLNWRVVEIRERVLAEKIGIVKSVPVE